MSWCLASTFKKAKKQTDKFSPENISTNIDFSWLRHAPCSVLPLFNNSMWIFTNCKIYVVIGYVDMQILVGILMVQLKALGYWWFYGWSWIKFWTDIPFFFHNCFSSPEKQEHSWAIWPSSKYNTSSPKWNYIF